MNGLRGKIDNWETINSKVLVKLGIPSLFASDVYDLANAKPGAIEDVSPSIRVMMIETTIIANINMQSL